MRIIEIRNILAFSECCVQFFGFVKTGEKVNICGRSVAGRGQDVGPREGSPINRHLFHLVHRQLARVPVSDVIPSQLAILGSLGRSLVI